MAERASWEYAVVEWLWDQDDIRVVLPDADETHQPGSYAEVVEVLTRLGLDGWEVSTNAGVGNWLLWTLRRSTW